MAWADSARWADLRWFIQAAARRKTTRSRPPCGCRLLYLKSVGLCGFSPSARDREGFASGLCRLDDRGNLPALTLGRRDDLDLSGHLFAEVHHNLAERFHPHIGIFALSTAHLHHEANLIAFFQELLCPVKLGLQVVFVGLGAHAHRFE